MARTKTYIAGDWTGDSDAIEQLYKWNEGDKWSFHFVDAHKNFNCYDSSMPCTIKASLSERMKNSKVFVLVVGKETDCLRKGSCVYQNCGNKRRNLWGSEECSVTGKQYDTKSFIDYECHLAYKAYIQGEMKIVVLYNAASIDKNKCPMSLRNIGTHVAMKSFNNYYERYAYDYNKVRNAIEA